MQWLNNKDKGRIKFMAKKKAAKKSPQKTCPKCGASVHVRKAVCDCGHKFGATTASKKKAAPKKKTDKFSEALKAEREVLQRKIDAIDELLN